MDAPLSTDPADLDYKVYPNTGHHFFFLPFGTDPRFPIEAIPAAIIELASGNQDAWKAYQELVPQPGQNECETYCWCQWRYGSDSEHGFQTGIWVSLETNLGTAGRGSLMRDAEGIAPYKDYQESEYPSPYYATTPFHEKLQHHRTEILLFAAPSPTAGAHGGAPAPGEVPAATHLDPFTQVHHVPPPAFPGVPQGWIPLQEFRFWWPEEVAAAVTEVDLIVDFGNSRSTALLLERPRNPRGGAGMILHDLVKPVRMMPRGRDFEPFTRLDVEDPHAIFDSWFVTRETLFSHLYPPRLQEAGAVKEAVIEPVEIRNRFFGTTTKSQVTKEKLRVPHMFMDLAPVALGTEATSLLSETQFKLGRTIFLSSPKRYLWDNHPIRPQSWGMIGNPRLGVRLRMNEKLAGHALQYMPDRAMPQHVPENQRPEDVSDWDLQKPPPTWPPTDRPAPRPDQAEHSRADTMIWVALAVLEQAYRQISTAGFLGEARQFVRRKLTNVVVTYPPGWTGRELEAYRRKWNTALHIFTHGHLAELSERPKLSMEYDEALGAQLPIIYSEIDKIGRSGGAWVRLIGRTNASGISRVRVMSIDIGGGTTDYAIFEYQDQLNTAELVGLKCKMLFKDSSTTAGDVLVRQLIESMLLPKLGRHLQTDEQRRLFDTFFQGPHGDATESWSRIVRLVLIPKINSWLARWGKDLPPSSSDQDEDRNIPIVNEKALEELNQLAAKAGIPGTLWDPQLLIDYSHEEMDQIVRKIFRPLFETVARIVAAFGVDMIILSGKPSELPSVRSLITETIPLLPCRILPVKNYEVGTWYPYQTAGRIYDAKTVTASGIALLRAVDADTGLVPGWSKIEIVPSDHLLRCNCWTAVPTKGKDVPIYLHNGCNGPMQEESATIRTIVSARIGRTLLPSLLSIEPVYVIAWKNQQDERFAKAIVDVRVRRKLPEDQKLPEYLELSYVAGTARYEGQEFPITLDMLELQLCTLTDTSFWIDAATFNIRWPRE